MAIQLMVDLYECESDIIDDMGKIKNISRDILKDLKTEIVEECCHKFKPVGITYIAVITTSHFSIHTWPENNYVAVDIFSCNKDLPEVLGEKLAKAFNAKYKEERKFERNIERRG